MEEKTKKDARMWEMDVRDRWRERWRITGVSDGQKGKGEKPGDRDEGRERDRAGESVCMC